MRLEKEISLLQDELKEKAQTIGGLKRGRIGTYFCYLYIMFNSPIP